MSCANEATESDHNHGHSHGGGSSGGGHSHDHDSAERGFEYSLYKHIDREGVKCLNAVDESQAKTVFRPWNERMLKNT
ncbi:hypothetical protein SARC_16511, partial [Sphaeroforma arctica JP610]